MEPRIIKKKLFLGLTVVLVTDPLPLRCNGGDGNAGGPCTQMEKHAEEAVEPGKTGHADALKKHAEAA